MELREANLGGFRSNRNGPQIMIIVAFALIAEIAMPLGLMAASEPAEKMGSSDILTAGTPVAIAFMLSILTMKVTAFVLGYLIVRLGHDTLVKGISGEIDFGFSGSGFKTKLKAASPGGLFVLMGAAIIIWGLAVQKPMEIKTVPIQAQTVGGAQDSKSGEPHRAVVPD